MPIARVTKEQKQEMVELRKLGWSYPKIAKKYGYKHHDTVMGYIKRMNGTELFKWATPKPIKTKQPIHKTMQKEPKLYKDYLPKKENVEDVRKWLRAKGEKMGWDENGG